jgi:predicted lipoprotein with Yx(FWY)xxD motif
VAFRRRASEGHPVAGDAFPGWTVRRPTGVITSADATPRPSVRVEAYGTVTSLRPTGEQCGCGYGRSVRTRLVAAAATAGLLAGCASSEPVLLERTTPPSTNVVASPSQTSPTTPQTVQPTSLDTSEPAGGTIIATAGSEFGDVLFDDTGQAIYLFDLENSSAPACYDQCAVEWPPVLTDGTPVAANGALADLLGITARADGSTQVTYAGHPLYYYAHEGKNEVLCHNFPDYGGVWFAISPTGERAPV